MTAEDVYWERLTAEVRAAVAAFDGAAGVCLLEPRGRRRLDVQADLAFGTASSIKTAILGALLRRVERGELDLADRYRLRPEQHVGGSGSLRLCADAVDISVGDLCRLMIALSDNTATNACIELCGGLGAVNDWIGGLGLGRTRLGRRMMDVEAAARGEDNLATPSDLAEMYRLLFDGAALGDAARATARAMLTLPKGSAFSDLARPGLDVADKPGYMAGIQCDAGYFFQSRRPFALAIMTSYGGPAAAAWLRELAARIVEAMGRLEAAVDGGTVRDRGLMAPDG